jgi:hypothetical protein
MLFAADANANAYANANICASRPLTVCLRPIIHLQTCEPILFAAFSGFETLTLISKA